MVALTVYLVGVVLVAGMAVRPGIGALDDRSNTVYSLTVVVVEGTIATVYEPDIEFVVVGGAAVGRFHE